MEQPPRPSQPSQPSQLEEPEPPRQSGSEPSQQAQGQDQVSDDKESSEAESSETELSEAERRRAGFAHKRTPSWLSDSPGMYSWKSEDARKQFREELQRESEDSKKKAKKAPLKAARGRGSGGGGDGGDDDDDDDDEGDEDDDDDDDVDDADMKYGIDPGFADLDEELRVIEGMITEHTVIEKVSVADADDVKGDKQVAAALRKLRLQSGTTGGLKGRAKSPETASVVVRDEQGDAEKQVEIQLEPASPPAAPVLTAELIKGKGASANAKPEPEPAAAVHTAQGRRPPARRQGDEAASATAAASAAASVAPVATAQAQAQDGEALAQQEAAVVAKASAEAAAEAEAEASASAEAEAGAAAAAEAEAEAARPKLRVRLVELPDHFAMLAREHKRQLLERQRRDLAIAAEAANARDEQQERRVERRSQNMIRRGYLDRLGIAGDTAPLSPSSVSPGQASMMDMGINARRAAIASARTRRRPPSMRVPLRESVTATSSKGKGFFRKLKSWMSADAEDDAADDAARAAAADGAASAASAGASGAARAAGAEAADFFHGGQGGQGGQASQEARPAEAEKRRVGFRGLVDVHFIPSRNDYPTKVRNAIWHTRASFVDMVLRNMDQMELEIQLEEEAKRRLQDLKDNPPPSLHPKKTRT